MNKLFSKIAALSVGLAMAVGVGVAVNSGSSKVEEVKAADPTTVTFSHTAISGMATSAAASTSGTYDVFTITVDGITSSGFNASESVRVYKGASITISCSAGNITSATLTCTANGTTKYGPGCFTGSGYTAGTGKDGTWTGDASSFTLVASSNQGRISDFSITYVAGGEVTNYTITYDANGGSGEMEDTVSPNPAVAACSFTAPEGKVFERWNTSADGNGDDYAVGATPGADLDLFAIWMDAPTCVTLTNIGSDIGSTASADLQTVDVVDSLTSETYTLNYVQCKKQGSAMLMTKNVNPLISNHTTIPGNIISVEVFINSGAAGGTTYDVAFGASEFTVATAGVGAVNITGGNSHVFDCDVADARYFCITLGNANNGQVLGVTINYEESDPSKDTLNILLNDATPSPATISYSTTGLFYANDKDGNDIDAEWSSSNESVFTVSKNGNNVGCVTPVGPGTANIIASADGFNDGVFVLTINVGSVDSIEVSGSMEKTEYTTSDSWSPAGLVVTASYSTGYEAVVSSGIEWNYNPASPALNVTSVVATATFGGQSDSSSAQTVSVTRVNPIQALYSKAKGASTGEFYGYYAGFATGSGPILMDGESGIMLYNNSQDVSGWTVGETIVHVTAGTIDIYNGLYEVKSYTCETVTSAADVAKPIVHITTGSETAAEANRSTNASGVVAAAPTKGSFDQDPAASDVQFTFTVGSNTFTVYYKKASQTTEGLAALKDSLDNHTEITLDGFTSWFNAFQLTMTGLIEAKEDYYASDFAQDLLDQTDAVCSAYPGDKDPSYNYNAYREALVEIWSDLASADKYPSLSADQKEILAEAARDEEGSVVEQAMARYDFLTGKYELSNFINGRTPMANHYNNLTVESNNNMMIIIVVISSATVLSLGVLIALKKKKHN